MPRRRHQAARLNCCEAIRKPRLSENIGKARRDGRFPGPVDRPAPQLLVLEDCGPLMRHRAGPTSTQTFIRLLKNPTLVAGSRT